MSAIADFRLIQTSKLDDLKKNSVPQKNMFGKVKDVYFDYLNKNTQSLKEYPWSGYIYATILVFLDQKGIELMKSSYDNISEFIYKSRHATCFVFTEEHKSNYLDKLNPKNFDINELMEYYNNFNETVEADAGQAMLDGIKILYENISEIKNKTAIIFGIY